MEREKGSPREENSEPGYSNQSEARPRTRRQYRSSCVPSLAVAFTVKKHRVPSVSNPDRPELTLGRSVVWQPGSMMIVLPCRLVVALDGGPFH